MSLFKKDNRHKFYMWGNTLLIILLMLSHISCKISPLHLWIMPFLAITFPFILFLNILCVLFWAAKKRFFWIFSSIAIIITISTTSKIFSIGKYTNTPDTEKKDTIKIMSWNVRLFDLYNWSNNEKTKAKMFQVLKEENSDIICFQEFYFQKKEKGVLLFNTRDTLSKFLKIKNIHEEYTDNVKKVHYFGAATFSKFPIVNKGKISFNDAPSNICIYTDILLNNKDTIRVYNIHLASIRFSKMEYTFIDNITDGEDDVTLEEGSLSIIKRMKIAYIKRAHQVGLVKEHIKKCRYPVILCGDFNDPPNSYTYSQLQENMNDAFTKHGFFMGHTYNGLLPIFRIDYILYDDYFLSTSFKTLKNKYSDHLPLVTTIQVK